MYNRYLKENYAPFHETQCPHCHNDAQALDDTDFLNGTFAPSAPESTQTFASEPQRPTLEDIMRSAGMQGMSNASTPNASTPSADMQYQHPHGSHLYQTKQTQHNEVTPLPGESKMPLPFRQGGSVPSGAVQDTAQTASNEGAAAELACSVRTALHSGAVNTDFLAILCIAVFLFTNTKSADWDCILLVAVMLFLEL